ncbi:hypothetical protein HED60_07500 [Planctomycetales bacterium ZRK34]|nr:hypothetical protein HED60_07500 [Planctomycetales bacterium ZRK34]
MTDFDHKLGFCHFRCDTLVRAGGVTHRKCGAAHECVVGRFWCAQISVINPAKALDSRRFFTVGVRTA